MSKDKTRHGRCSRRKPDQPEALKPATPPELDEPEDGDMATPKEEASTEDDKPLD
jgi:hypothetical protein